jgi:tetratricopeptide (TPR) repeat protein
LQGRFGEAEPLIVESITLMQKAGKPLEDVIALAQWGLALAGRGNYAEGLKQAQVSLARVQEINFVYGIEVNYVLLAWIHFLGGDTLQSLQAANQAVELARAVGDWIQVFTGSVFAAWASSRLGQHSVALEIITQIQARLEKLKAQLVGMEVFMGAHAEIELNANQIDKALTLAQQAVTTAHANDVVFAEGIAQRVWANALVARKASWEEIEPHFAASLAAFEKGDVRLEMARTHIAWGKALQVSGNVRTAREHFEKAVAQFQVSKRDLELEQVNHLLDEVRVAN